MKIINSECNHNDNTVETTIKLDNGTNIIFENDSYEIYATDPLTGKKYEIIEFKTCSQICVGWTYNKILFSVRLKNKVPVLVDENFEIIVITDGDKKFYPNDFYYNYCYDLHDIFGHEFWPAIIYGYFDIDRSIKDIDADISVDDETNVILVNENFEPLKTKDGEIITWGSNEDIVLELDKNKGEKTKETFKLVNVMDKNITPQKIVCKYLYVDKDLNTLKADNKYMIGENNFKLRKRLDKSFYKVTIYINPEQKKDVYMYPNLELFKTSEGDIIEEITKKHIIDEKSVYEVRTIEGKTKFVDKDLNIIKLGIK